MARRRPAIKRTAAPTSRPSALLDTRVVYCGDCLDQLRKPPDARVLKKTGSFYYHCDWHAPPRVTQVLANSPCARYRWGLT